MRPDVMLIHYEGEKPSALPGDHSLMDAYAPGWRELPLRNLKLEGSNLDPAGRARRIIKANPRINVVVALGRDAATSLGLHSDAQWFMVYEVGIDGRKVLVIPVPQPSRVNRLWNSESTKAKMTDLFAKSLV